MSITYHKLKSVTVDLSNFCFNGCDKESIGITKYDAIWTNSQEKYRLSFKKTYFTVGGAFCC